MADVILKRFVTRHGHNNSCQLSLVTMIAHIVLHIGVHYRSVSSVQVCTTRWNLCQCYFKFHFNVSVCQLGTASVSSSF